MFLYRKLVGFAPMVKRQGKTLGTSLILTSSATKQSKWRNDWEYRSQVIAV